MNLIIFVAALVLGYVTKAVLSSTPDFVRCIADDTLRVGARKGAYAAKGAVVVPPVVVNQPNQNQTRARKRPAPIITSGPIVQVQSAGMPVSTATLRNRRRRQRRRARLGAMNPAFARSYYGRYFSNADPTMQESVHKLIQTQFYPQKGISRGIASGFDLTAITMYQGSLEMTTSAVNNILTFAFMPNNYKAVNMISWLAGISIADPFSSTGNVNIPGPFNTLNPSLAGRVVSATLNIVPASTVLNRGGEGKVAYASAYEPISFTRTGIENYAISRGWDGAESMSLHWSPGDSEYAMSSGAAASPSILCGYIVLPTGTVSAWRLEWQVGIEYEATVTYRPLVDRKPPLIRPDARYFLNAVAREHWTPLMISTLNNYQERLALNDSDIAGHLSSQFVNHAGLGGVGFRNPVDYDIIEQAAQEQMSEEDLNPTARNLRELACETLSGVTGEDFCSTPLQAGLKTASRMMGLRGASVPTGPRLRLLG